MAGSKSVALAVATVLFLCVSGARRRDAGDGSSMKPLTTDK
ncbi:MULTISPECIES: hypothetical protein [unclassified Bradyrhizobium]|nr:MULTISPECIES: hypothetical protein [unclassified Bradyrhizobium]